MSACVRARTLRCVRSPGCSPRLGPLHSFTHPHLRFHFLCPELCSELLLPSFALGPSLPPPPASGLWAWLSSLFHLPGLRFLVARRFCLCPLPRPLHPPVPSPPRCLSLSAGWWWMLSLSSSHALSFSLSPIPSSGSLARISPLPGSAGCLSPCEPPSLLITSVLSSYAFSLSSS